MVRVRVRVGVRVGVRVRVTAISAHTWRRLPQQANLAPNLINLTPNPVPNQGRPATRDEYEAQLRINPQLRRRPLDPSELPPTYGWHRPDAARVVYTDDWRGLHNARPEF